MLNLLGTSNPLGSAAPNYVVWGNVAGWSSSYYVVWGNTIQAPSGPVRRLGQQRHRTRLRRLGQRGHANSTYVVWGNSLPAAVTERPRP